jgi:phosphopantothenoylcysteine decarboxylase/phosphopantothenate--cysteine ligase
MNFAMYQSAPVQRNLDVLRADGFHIVEPTAGRLACGEEGQGRFPEIAQIISTIQSALEPKANGKTILVTAGRTEEPIDPVRMITNRSSGKTGVAIAQAFRDAGFRVILVQGPMDQVAPDGCEVISVSSALQMHAAVLSRQQECDGIIFCAAVADYRPKVVASEKIKDSRSQLLLELEPNPSILADCAKLRKPSQLLIGFALETENPLKHGIQKLAKTGADFLVVNTPVKAASGFGLDVVEYAILSPSHNLGNAPALALGSKTALAGELVQKVRNALGIQAVGPCQ